MTRRRLTSVAALALMAALLAPVGSAQAQPAGNPVTAWNLIAASTLVALPAPGGGAAPTTQVNMGMVQGAVYDAVNAITAHHHRPYLLQRRFGVTSSTHAAVAAAASRVLRSIITTVPNTITFTNRQALLDSVDAAYAAAIAEIPAGPKRDNGVRAGRAAADAMIAARQGDGRFGPSPWKSNTAVPHWQPLLNAQGAPVLDPTPWLADMRPFFLESTSQFRSRPPLDVSSAQYAADLNEVQAIGSVNSALRTADQTHIARFWQTNIAAAWNATTRGIIADRGIGIADSARLLAMTNMAAGDAAINCWNDKYHFDYWRPWNAIPRAGEDNNPATTADATWAALITAPYPEYPSGHNCIDAAHLHVLLHFLGTDEVHFSVPTATFPGEVRSFDRFSDALKEVIEVRIWAGLHFRDGDVQGQVLGRNVVDYMEANFFQAVGGG